MYLPDIYFVSLISAIIFFFVCFPGTRQPPMSRWRRCCSATCWPSWTGCAPTSRTSSKDTTWKSSSSSCRWVGFTSQPSGQSYNKQYKTPKRFLPPATNNKEKQQHTLIYFITWHDNLVFHEWHKWLWCSQTHSNIKDEAEEVTRWR